MPQIGFSLNGLLMSGNSVSIPGEVGGPTSAFLSRSDGIYKWDTVNDTSFAYINGDPHPSIENQLPDTSNAIVSSGLASPLVDATGANGFPIFRF